MPRDGMSWWHVMWHTYGAWLPGDPRGFRDRDHRIHSSGDYKRPPPPGEHEGLHRYAKRVSDPEVVLATPELRREVCEALVATVDSIEFRAAVVTVCRVHVHLVIELPTEREPFDRAVTQIKTKSSAIVEHKPAMRLWARKWRNVLCDTREHRDEAVVYVRDKQGRYTCTWTMQDSFIRSN